MKRGYVLNLGKIRWKARGAGLREKKIQLGPYQFRFVEFSGGFKEDGWCTRAHYGFVFHGRAVISFGGRRFCIHKGDVLSIPAGRHQRHKVEITGKQRICFVFCQRSA